MAMTKMINNKVSLKYCLQQDLNGYQKVSHFFSRLKNVLVTNPINTQYLIYRYIINLRYSEYHYNNSLLSGYHGVKAILHSVCLIYRYWKLRRISYKMGVQIPPNVCGPGLQIWHYGYIIINAKTRIGKNVTLYPGVEIGHKVPGGPCPTIGDNCFIGAGVKIFGGVHIGDNVTIGANAVVTHDIPKNAVVGGIPAKIIKFKNEK